MKNIIYAIDADGCVVSRVGSEIACPVLDYGKIGQDGDFRGPMIYNLDKFSVYQFVSSWDELKWTKKIPRTIKNKHRKFWGFKPLRDK